MSKNRMSGFSIIEVMVATAMLGGLALAGMQLMKNQNDAQKSVEKKYESVTVVSDMRALLSNPDNCTESFRGLHPAEGVPTKLKKRVNSSFENVYAKGTIIPGNIKIDNYKLDKTIAGMPSNETALKIDFNFGKASLREHVTNILKITYVLDPDTGLIASCNAINNNSDTFWFKAASDPHNIFFNGGNVGIGIANPEHMLDVTGNVRVGGKVKLGGTDPVTTCTTTNEGELRYDSTSHRMLFCNGTKWTSMGGTLMRQMPVNLTCTGADVDETSVSCPSDMYVRSCGIEMAAPLSDAPDSISCTIDTVLNRCIGYRRKAGPACDDAISLQCFCQ